MGENFVDLKHGCTCGDDVCPTGEHMYGCCHCCDHDYPTTCSCGPVDPACPIHKNPELARKEE